MVSNSIINIHIAPNRTLNYNIKGLWVSSIKGGKFPFYGEKTTPSPFYFDQTP